MTTLVNEIDYPDAATLPVDVFKTYLSGYVVRSGAAEPATTNTNVAQLIAQLATADHYCEIQMGNTTGGSFKGPAVRMPALGNDGTVTGSFYLLTSSGSTGTAFQIRRKEDAANTLTTLASGNSSVPATGSGFRWRLRAYQDPNDLSVTVLEAWIYSSPTDTVGERVCVARDSLGLVPTTNRRVGFYCSGSTSPTWRVARIVAADQAPEPVYVPPPVDSTAPPVPSGLSASQGVPGAVSLTWGAVTDDDLVGYRLYRSTDSTITTAEQIAAPTGTTYSDTGLPEGATYWYAVAAVDGSGNVSGMSTAASVVVPSTPVVTPPTTDQFSVLLNGTVQPLTLLGVGLGGALVPVDPIF